MSELSVVPEHLLRMTMPNLDSEGYLSPELSEPEMSWMALNSLYFVISRAQTAGAHGASWRDKIVGSAAYCIDADNSRSGLVGGFNIRTHDEADINIHAEHMVTERAEFKEYKNIPLLGVWGEPETDEVTGKTPLTLLPCRLCVEYMRGSPLINEHTAILSGNSDFSICELYGLGDLVEYYESGGSSKENMQRMILTLDALENRDYDEALFFLLLDTWSRLNPEARYSSELREWFDAGQPTT